MSRNAKKPRPTIKPVAHWRKAAQSIPFIGLLGSDDELRNARMALRDPKTTPELRAELKRYLADPFHAAAVDQQKLLTDAVKACDEAEQLAAPFRKGKPRDDTTRALVRELGLKHPKVSASELYKKAPRGIRLRVELGRFRNILSEEAPRRRRKT
ncbi:MAG TPA: hypothetical protein VGM84_26250 [Steroidobacteraceae bacterium]|jgi:hypothetical protein